MARDVSTGYKAFLIVTTLVLALAFGIPSIVIGSDFHNNPTKLLFNGTNGTALCGVTNSEPPIPIWLIVYGSMSIFGAVCICLGILVMDSSKGPFAFSAIIFGCFNLAWNIVGAVALFRDSSCAQTVAYPMWAMVLADLIITWINMLISCVTGTNVK